VLALAGEPPVILKSKISRAGQAEIEFSQDLEIPHAFYSFNSENEGVTIFAVSLEINELNRI